MAKLIVPKGITSPKVTVKDAANELNGVVISLAPDAPSTVNITACGSSSTVLGKGDIILLTCGSTEIKVIQGDAFTRLNTSDRSFIQGTLTEGNLIIFDPAKRTLKADSDNAAVIDLSVVGNKKMNEIILGAGKIVTVPPSGNAPIPTPTLQLQNNHLLRLQNNHLLRLQNNHLLRLQNNHLLRLQNNHLLRLQNNHLLRLQNNHLLQQQLPLVKLQRCLSHQCLQ